MALAPEWRAREAMAEGSLRVVPTPFLTKTYRLVDDPKLDDIISWNDDGTTFVVWRPTEFASDLLPKYFKHNNLSSFIRQLNIYGFRKVVPDRWEFANDCFRRGEKRLLCDIQRKKTSTAVTLPHSAAATSAVAKSPMNLEEEHVLSAGAVVDAAADPREENEWLRKENDRLSREVAQMKRLCGNITTLLWTHVSRRRERSRVAAVSPLLEHMPTGPAAEAEGAVMVEKATSSEAASVTNLMLFGMSIRVKRAREDDDDDSSPKAKQKEKLVVITIAREQLVIVAVVSEELIVVVVVAGEKHGVGHAIAGGCQNSTSAAWCATGTLK
ncbi:hypothetical protein Cni_G21878 [Canna indica]|uniref:HSF-type DNA-binding domain-containing protein n=1 Tax=Canna indica TaxID=4628 RepID=A0AAQ3QJ42_9LILI|nr:hypothetical protein Cni_G21878 [Canna indica]